MLSDSTDPKQSVKILQARVRLMDFAVSHSLAEVLQATLDEMEALTASTIGFYHFLEADQKTLMLQAWSTDTIRNMCSAEGRGHRYDISQAGVWVDCIRERRPIIHNDYLSLTHRKGLPPGHAAVFRELIIPIFRGGCIKAIIGVGNKAENYNEQDIEIVSLLADFAWDIAERKRTEEALRESEERFRTLTDLSPVGVYLTDSQGCCQYVNQRWLDIAGMTFEEAMGDGWINGIYPDDRQLILSKWRQMIESCGQWGLEYRFQTPAGKITWVLGLATELHNSLNEKIGYIGVNTDITEKKHIEEILRQNEERYRTLVETMNEGFVVLNKDMAVVYINDQFCRISGYEKEEVIGKNIAYYFDEEYQRIIREQFMKREQGQFGSYEIEITRKDNSKGIVAVSGKPIFDSENSFQGSLAVISDITLRKETETMLVMEHQALKKQTTTDIESLNEEVQGYYYALKVLLKNAKDDKKAMEAEIVSNVREMVAPFFDKLKNTRLNDNQKVILDVIEANLNNIISPFVGKLKAEMRDFTPMEIQVANLIKEGRSNKDIADILAISDNTVMFHRTNIRKKLGLQHQKTNLRTYLLSLSAHYEDISL